MPTLDVMYHDILLADLRHGVLRCAREMLHPGGGGGYTGNEKQKGVIDPSPNFFQIYE